MKQNREHRKTPIESRNMWEKKREKCMSECTVQTTGRRRKERYLINSAVTIIYLGKRIHKDQYQIDYKFKYKREKL